MCTRFARMSLMASLKHAFEFNSEFELIPKYNIAPSDVADIVTHVDGKRTLEPMLFGLIPHWAKDPKIAFSCLNARSETVEQKPAFRNAFKKRRCLVLADGFFEWQREGKIKIPYFIQMNNSQPFAMAGLWESWERSDGKEIKSFTIVTTRPNNIIGKIHDRMPVILSKENISTWLSPETDLNTLKSILEPYRPESMKINQVSPYVSNSRNKGPECIIPVPNL